MRASIIFGIVYVVICIALVTGYVMNVYKLFHSDFSNKTSYKREIIYGIGACTGLGCVIGYFDIEDK